MAIEGDRPAPEEVSDVGALKALAHTRRQAILQQLYRKGPATSTGLARDLGWNTGATSYHLRELARTGSSRNCQNAPGAGTMVACGQARPALPAPQPAEPKHAPSSTR